MSQKEQEMLEKIQGLPEKLQEKFLDKLDGAAMALDSMAATGKGESDGSSGTEPG